MGAFELPRYITNYLNTGSAKPPVSFVNFSQYYANLDPYFMNYMNGVIRPCIAYGTGAQDGVMNDKLKLNVGYTIVKNAVGLVTSGKVMYEGDNAGAHFLSDHWQGAVNFNDFYQGWVRNLLLGGTSAVKLNIDGKGRCFPTSSRVDRYYATVDDLGNVIYIVFFNSFLFSQKYGDNIVSSYWLVEERYYKNGSAYVRYKVATKSGIAGSETLPTINTAGVAEKSLPEEVKALLRQRGIKVNKELALPFRDGLGVWLTKLTATNSCVPGLPMGDPILYGALDLLWSADVVYSGSLIDVLNGKGKVLIPKRFASTVRSELMKFGIGNDSAVSLSERIMQRLDEQSDDDDSLVEIATEHDKSFPPQSVQFPIRTGEYSGMLELYLRHIVSICGFAPSSLFPFLADNSVKTATEVTADENLTRNTVDTIHKILEPILSRIVNEVVYQLYRVAGQEYEGEVKVKLTDYIGNPLQRDQNTRDNLNAGLIPLKKAVQRVNELTDEDTEEYVNAIKEENKERNASYGMDWNTQDYFGDNENGESVNNENK